MKKLKSTLTVRHIIGAVEVILHIAVGAGLEKSGVAIKEDLGAVPGARLPDDDPLVRGRVSRQPVIGCDGHRPHADQQPYEDRAE
jgi:hypothetical protein